MTKNLKENLIKVTIDGLFKVVTEHGNESVINRVRELIDKDQRTVVAGMEQIIIDFKTGDLVADTPTKQIIKYAYRKVTS